MRNGRTTSIGAAPWLLAGLAACASCQSESPRSAAPTAPEQAGIIVSSTILEASGLARSNLRSDRLWIINDSGSPAELHAIGMDGSDQGSVRIDNVENTDWEDLASFELNGAQYLMIADIGDNAASRENATLHFVPEPKTTAGGTVTASRSISFRYPNGPRDAEAIAVDPDAGAVYVLSKRTVPAELYAVPFSPAPPAAGPVTARYLGPVDSLPRPPDDDLKQLTEQQIWSWQPTAMDFAADGKFATILTYRAALTYSRTDGESWYEALQSEPTVRALGDFNDAESMCMAGRAIFVTLEGKNPPLLRFAL